MQGEIDLDTRLPPFEAVHSLQQIFYIEFAVANFYIEAVFLLRDKIVFMGDPPAQFSRNRIT